MFGSGLQGARAYAEVGVETGVGSASPHQLIVMLFDGALAALSQAQQHMRAGNVAGKGQAVSKAIAIIGSGLRTSLDKEKGGEIAGNLDALYDYMCNRLVVANLNNQLELFKEVDQLLMELKQAWVSIGEKAAPPVAPASAPKAYDPLEPVSSRLVKA